MKYGRGRSFDFLSTSIDGADEIDPQLGLLKVRTAGRCSPLEVWLGPLLGTRGGGRDLTREVERRGQPLAVPGVLLFRPGAPRGPACSTARGRSSLSYAWRVRLPLRHPDEVPHYPRLRGAGRGQHRGTLSDRRSVGDRVVEHFFSSAWRTSARLRQRSTGALPIPQRVSR